MEGFLAIICIFVVLPGMIFHYVTKWKTAPTLTQGDEEMLDELYRLARRLDERMDTVERLVAADNDEFSKPRLIADQESDNLKLAELERMMKERNAQ
ncbi:envelope stress response membrane protein PspB [Croceicoccus sp. Ery15]|uniref:envelope stress response membrane protein PspB n=1 Tax=Croceicoccus sp. Ery15 TaxID=1703338 RepID=UPI001E390A23|nr:envelope stress response membrane protein PspB [Croceicoccus sp. Ery15]